MTFIGKLEATETIKNLIRKYDFEVDFSHNDNVLPGIKEDSFNRKATISITTHSDFHNYESSGENIMYKYKVIAQATISTMGGNPTTQELLAASDEIRRKALLAEEINSANLEFFTIYKKYQ